MSKPMTPGEAAYLSYHERVASPNDDQWAEATFAIEEDRAARDKWIVEEALPLMHKNAGWIILPEEAIELQARLHRILAESRGEG